MQLFTFIIEFCGPCTKEAFNTKISNLYNNTLEVYKNSYRVSTSEYQYGRKYSDIFENVYTISSCYCRRQQIWIQATILWRRLIFHSLLISNINIIHCKWAQAHVNIFPMDNVTCMYCILQAMTHIVVVSSSICTKMITEILRDVHFVNREN